ncbi:SDR family NAD(P)-dependent oxidoreductase [Streptomyces spongiae]|uniref:SDR family NAD(P)-dependent oxidoreductase n=1 Tax=Streptomyces spongiae TaxID=565072 RepID=A0A5N8XY94_9ACTN|nr:beta-ketoacyl reductase [Streptomyces spongiae]MPY64343.1 SDR family NAD(P)-dependent oxidoreductase [Streptomyces spongiae]
MRDQAARLRAFVASDTAVDIVDVGYSLITTRPGFEERAVVIAADRQEFLDSLDALAHGEVPANTVRGTAEPGGQTAPSRPPADDAASDPPQSLASLAETYVRGGEVDWHTAFAGTNATQVRLPTYAFQHQRYWLDTPRHTTDGAGRTRQGVRSTVDSGRYRVAWRLVAEASSGPPSGRWLVVTPADRAEHPWVRAVTRALTGCGVRVLPVEVPYAAVDRKSMAERLTDVRDRAGALDDEPVAGLLSFLSLEEASHPDDTAVAWGMAANLALVQALGDVGISAPLWCVTCGAVSIGPSDPVTNPLQALIWGMGGVVAAECPERWGGLIDLPGDVRDQALPRLISALAGANAECEFAVRDSGLFVRRLVHAPLGETETAREWRSKGTVLITGSPGAIGGHVARWLAGNGAEHLLFTSPLGRQAPGAAELEGELTALGAEVTFVACDVADRAQLAKALAVVPDGHPLTAVVHTAEVLDDAPVDSLTLDQVGRVSRVKVGGARNLHHATRELDLSAFVLFSSITGVCGMPGQGNYAPGNAFLDALARHRKADGLPATSIAWGHWDGAGIADPDVSDVGGQPHRHATPAMAPEPALTALGQALEHDETHLVIAEADWAAVSQARPRYALLDDLPDVQRLFTAADGGPGGVPGQRPSELVQRLAGMSEPEQRRTLLRIVRKLAAAVQGHRSPDSINPERGFRDQGFDSLIAVEFRNRLNTETGLLSPMTIAFDYPSPVALADQLRRELLPQQQTTVTTVLSEIDKLESVLSAASLNVSERAATASRLQELLARWRDSAHEPSAAGVVSELASATDQELIEFIGNEFGID